VVTNSIGSEGVDGKNYQEFVIEDSARGIADAVLSLVEDPSRARRIGECGWRFVRSRFSFEKIQADYLQLLRDLTVREDNTEKIDSL
jgi:glycosyltransferase involved in cell wall biosynthesis